MNLTKVATKPIDGQKPGTSGLRKKTRVFMEPGYLENFVQAVFDATGGAAGKTFVVGGDGRFFNAEAIQIILRMAAANGARKVFVGQDGLLSTPAASHLIRKNRADGGFILSASHNPGGLNADFGIKFNMANGGPASESLTEAIFAETTRISEYRTLLADDIDLNQTRELLLGEMMVSILDPVADYMDLMAELFDFDAIRALFQSGFKMRFDAMHAITGPYAKTIFEQTLGAPKGTVLNAVPQPDFGGGHPDPNPTWARELMLEIMADDGPDFGAASDGDGDRNMILGRHTYVSPSDSLAVLAANASCAPGYKQGLAGIARSMPTSCAADRVAEALGFDAYETPTGWKFFGNLLDDGRVTLCGEESFGTGSDHVREKDGLWAVLLWLNILAVKRKSVGEILRAHWQAFGRNYYSRHDYEGLPTDEAEALMAQTKARFKDLPGRKFGPLVVHSADNFTYDDPCDGSVSHNQGLRILFKGGARAVFRLSGTGTEGATLRLYLECLETDPDHLDEEVQAKLAPVARAAAEISGLGELNRAKPDVIT